MLYEDDVVRAVAAYLREHGYAIRQALAATERGVDIVAVKTTEPAFELHVEAKGAGSSRSGSARFGFEFNSGQVFDHVAKAVLKALQAAAFGATDRRGAIALPANRLHEYHVKPVAAALRSAGIAIFWVAEDGGVTLDAPWEL